jgi:DnaJ family protein C protein 25
MQCLRYLLLALLFCCVVAQDGEGEDDDVNKNGKTNELYEWATDAKELGKDYYELLGLKQSATASDVQKAYIALSRIYHPDQNADEKAAKIFAAIAKARKILTDPKIRAEYDKVLIRGEPVQDEDFTMPGLQYYTKFEGAPTHNTFSVLFLVIAIFSVLEYLFIGYRYTATVQQAMLTPSYRAAVKARREELRIAQGLSPIRKRKSGKSKGSSSEPEEDLEIELVDLVRPDWTHLTIVRLSQPWVWGPCLIGRARGFGTPEDKPVKIKGAMKITHNTVDHGEQVD